MSVQCDTCGRFLDFADLCFSEHHFTPLNEFGPEESSFTGPCCRWRTASAIEARSGETGTGSTEGESAVPERADAKPVGPSKPHKGGSSG